MNYYLVEKRIAESLDLVKIRKSTPDGLFLLSEYDLSAYGVAKAISEGAIVLSSGNGGVNSVINESQNETEEAIKPEENQSESPENKESDNQEGNGEDNNTEEG